MKFVFSDIKLFSQIKFVFRDIDCKHLVAFPAQGKKSSVALFAFPSTRSLPAALDTTFRFPRDNIFVLAVQDSSIGDLVSHSLIESDF